MFFRAAHEAKRSKRWRAAAAYSARRLAPCAARTSQPAASACLVYDVRVAAVGAPHSLHEENHLMQRRSALLLLLGSALAGCAGGDSSKPDQSDEPAVDASAPTVLIEVKGMT
jgi:hypothetical protein